MDIKLSSKRSNSDKKSTRERLTGGVLALWTEAPSSEISTRALARMADTAVSAIDYHFGGLDHLYAEAQARALSEAGDWMEARIVQLAALEEARLDASGVASIVAATIDDWTEGMRPLAMAWREACSSARNGTNLASHTAWMLLWKHYWDRVSALVGMPQHADLLAAFHGGEATQHLLRWKRALDRALLDETVRALINHLHHVPRGPSPVRKAYQILAERDYACAAEADWGSSALLDVAAAEILRDAGVSALTFRGVADRAGTTLGNASYHFGSKSKMLKRAFETLYRMSSGSQNGFRLADDDALREALLDGVSAGNQSILRAFDEIILHISRSRDNAALRGVIRGYRDPAAGWALERLLHEDEPISSSLCSAFSSICRGLDHLSIATGTEGSRKIAQAVLDQFLHR